MKTWVFTLADTIWELFVSHRLILPECERSLLMIQSSLRQSCSLTLVGVTSLFCLKRVITSKAANEPPRDKTNTMTVRPAKTQISLDIRPVWSESSLCAQRVAKDPSFLHADSEDSDQTGRMPRLIWVFAGRTCHFVGFVMMRLNCCLGRTKTSDFRGKLMKFLFFFTHTSRPPICIIYNFVGQNSYSAVINSNP